MTGRTGGEGDRKDRRGRVTGRTGVEDDRKDVGEDDRQS